MDDDTVVQKYLCKDMAILLGYDLAIVGYEKKSQGRQVQKRCWKSLDACCSGYRTITH